MPRLPDVTSFGARPVPRPTRGLADPQSAGRGVQRAANAQLAAAGEAGRGVETVNRAVQVFAAKQIEIQDRDDAVERARALEAFQNESSAELARLQTESDLSKREVAQGYIEGLQKRQAALMEAHGGSGASRTMLNDALTQARGDYSRQAAAARLTAQRELVSRTMATSLAGMAARAYEAPGNLDAIWGEVDSKVDLIAGGLTPDEEQAFRVTGREQTAVSALESLLDRGRYQDAAEALAELPSATLSPVTRRQIESRIAQAEMVEVEAAAAGRRKMAELESFLGRPLTPAERTRAAGLSSEPVKTDLMIELESAGLRPGTAEYQTALLAARTKPTTVFQNPTQAFGFETAEQRQNAALEQIGTAASARVNAAALGNLLVDGVATGPLESGKSLLRAVASDLGVSIDEESLGRSQEFQRIANNLALDSMQRFKGAMSERELDFGISTVANLGRSEEGNIRAIAGLQAAAEIALENANRLSAASDLEGYKALERQIAARGADDIMARTQEIETELRARLAAGTVAPSLDSINRLTADQARDFVNNHSEAELDAMGPSILNALRSKLTGASGPSVTIPLPPE